MFPKMKEVTICPNKDLEEFIQAVTVTMNNHLHDVEDDFTRNCLNDPVHNEITTAKPVTPIILARMLEVTDDNDGQEMGMLVELLLKEFPVLKSYWALRANKKAFMLKG